jgi:hypothetical protein
MGVLGLAIMHYHEHKERWGCGIQKTLPIHARRWVVAGSWILSFGLMGVVLGCLIPIIVPFTSFFVEDASLIRAFVYL